MSQTKPWEQRIGRQRYWIWRGWQIRYTYFRAFGQSPVLRGKTTEPAGERWSGSDSKPPLILLHGFGVAIEHWRHNIPVLAQSHTVYALDLLGFGGSTKAATDYSAYLWAQMVYDFWQQFINQPVILVGNSLGALVSLIVAANYPKMVTGIAMLSLPDVSLRQEMLPRWLRPIVGTLENLVAPPPVIIGLLSIIRRSNITRACVKLAYHDRSAVTDELVEMITSPAYDEGASGVLCLLAEGIRKPEFAPSVKAILPSITIPMLLLWGRQDRLIPPVLAPIFAKLNSRITLIEWDQVGHCPHDECPDQFNALLLDWIETVISKQ